MKTRKVNVLITDERTDTEVFRKDGFEVPESWSDRAATIVASKYATDKETSAWEIIRRVTDQIARWGVQQGYFDTSTGVLEGSPDGLRFQDLLDGILVNQRASFNSPVWFNCGVPENKDQMSACFIFPVEDDMVDILEHTKREGMVFKSGSGAGVNVSKLRAKGEQLSNKGFASGPISFMKMWDACAGSVKSGGKTRRSAKLVCMDADHPDIMEFIKCKLLEEEKAKILMKAGYSDEEAYATVAFQNANHSIRVADEFMETVMEDGMYCLLNRGEKDEYGGYTTVAREIRATDIFHALAETAWATGDPGIQFDDRMNDDNPVPSMGRINSTNPCQPGFATILAPNGILSFDDLSVGQLIWSGKDWTKVTHKVFTGIKPVFEFITTAGVFVGTNEHRIFQGEERVKVEEAEAIDLCPPRLNLPEIRVDKQDVVDGWVFGDGSSHKASNNLVYLNLGEDDTEPFLSGYRDYYVKDRTKLSKYAHEVSTSIKAIELGKTYDREIPDRFLFGHPSRVVGFLKGLYNANGSVCGGRVTLKASSFKVIQGVQQMLSSLGIQSYYTTNKKHDVVFGNGLYECKESYDLNIIGGRHLFSQLIGFDHIGKKERLKEILKAPKSCKPPKKTYEIICVNELGEFPVWDIRVEAEEHSYWSGGLLVSNCSEFSAVDNSSCNLASLNLVKYYSDKWDFHINWDLFEEDIKVMVTAMDILVDAAVYPTKEVREVTIATRPLGLGFTNLGALLILMGLPYDSVAAREVASGITQKMTLFALEQSVLLAQKLGPFAAFEKNKEEVYSIYGRLTENETLWRKPPPIRNSQLTLLAPTGTISFMMDCDTTGIEPLFALEATKTLAGGGTMVIAPQCVKDALAQMETVTVGNLSPNRTQQALEISHLPAEKKAIFKTANEIHWRDHILMMAACQKHLNGAISKTVNMPADCTPQDIMEAYQFAWEQGLKSLAVYRDGCKAMQPLRTNLEEYVATLDDVLEDEGPKWSPIRRKLPDTRHSITHKFSISGIEGFIQPSMYEDGALGEIFLRVQKQGSTINGLMDAFAVMTSLALQYGVPLEAMTEKLTQTRFDPQGITRNESIPMCTSMMDYIFRWLMQQFGEEDIDSIDDSVGLQSIIPPVQKKIDASGPPCHICGSITSRVGTCYLCSTCGATTGCS